MGKAWRQGQRGNRPTVHRRTSSVIKRTQRTKSLARFRQC